MKPLIFISHIHEHKQLGLAIKREIGNLLLSGVDFFVSSDRVSIVGGDRWLDQIEAALSNASIVLVICSQDSVHRPWVNFEAGGAWMAKKRVVPLCCGDLRPSDLPQPLASRQAYSISEPDDLKDLVALIAREAGLNPPDFVASDLVRTLGDALNVPADESDDTQPSTDFRQLPSAITVILTLPDHDFFDDLWEHDARDNARDRVEKEMKNILAELRAVLAMRLGPKLVKLRYSRVEFPGGAVSATKREDLRSSGWESSVWCEVSIQTLGEELALLQELRNHDSLRRAKTKKINFSFKGAIDLGEFAEDIFNRKIPVKRFGADEISFGKIDEIGAEVSVRSLEEEILIELSDYDFEELDVGSALGPVFSYLKISDHLKSVAEENAS